MGGGGGLSGRSFVNPVSTFVLHLWRKKEPQVMSELSLEKLDASTPACWWLPQGGAWVREAKGFMNRKFSGQSICLMSRDYLSAIPETMLKINLCIELYIYNPSTRELEMGGFLGLDGNWLSLPGKFLQED